MNDARQVRRGPGRPPVPSGLTMKARKLRQAGMSWTSIARELDLGRTTVRRLCSVTQGRGGAER